MADKTLIAGVVDLVNAVSFWLHDPDGGNDFGIDCMSGAVRDVLTAIRASAEFSELHDWADKRLSDGNESMVATEDGVEFRKIPDLTAMFNSTV